ncbi:unnamed protein product [Heligmosomoides polygyrus]|uniref:CS domain-containing protein n=1 Tax=Heligmosomoides polygyrus TaxID=6339 RepID=A0A3P8CI41_HELPZ|nr:unnamed protein product [Heligmosomoides polygyrus]
MLLQKKTLTRALEGDEKILHDVEELRYIRGLSKRPNVQKWLVEKIEELSAQLPEAVPEQRIPSPTVKTEKSSNSTGLPTVKVTNYGWDESDKFVKVYITLQGVHNANPSSIQHSFSNNGYDIAVSGHCGKNYVMTMKGLRDEIVPESSQIKQKTDMLMVMMKKKTEGLKWEQLTKIEYDEKQKR